MKELDEILIRTIQNMSEQRAARFSSEFVRASPDEKEGLLAALEIENWVVEICRACRPDRDLPRFMG